MKNEKKALLIIALIIMVGSVVITPERAIANAEVYQIKIKDHQFQPNRLEVPANKKFKLEIINLDPTAEEFESHSFNREKIVNGNSTVSMFVGPLAAGEYSFFGEFNPDTAKGTIVVK